MYSVSPIAAVVVNGNCQLNLFNVTKTKNPFTSPQNREEKTPKQYFIRN